jgi:hypothetical protein
MKTGYTYIMGSSTGVHSAVIDSEWNALLNPTPRRRRYQNRCPQALPLRRPYVQGSR